MTIEGKRWVCASKRVRKAQSGGIHVYINADVLQFALESTNIKPTDKLEVRRYPLKGTKNTAEILLKIRKVK